MFLCVNSGEAETVVKRSRFIAVARPADSRAAVKRFIDGLRAEYSDATHVCYGFIADESGFDFGYDDDGEPSGTGGKPIYSALASSGARRSAIAVVRYFGGIKLGAGGLTRAYREAAAAVIDRFGLSAAECMAVYSVSCGGGAYKKVMPVLRGAQCITESIVYSETVEMTVLAPDDFDLAAALAPLGAEAVKTGERTVTADTAADLGGTPHSGDGNKR